MTGRIGKADRAGRWDAADYLGDNVAQLAAIEEAYKEGHHGVIAATLEAVLRARRRVEK